jgi:phosphatidylethanolamine/phosphatidyl-N-methylethanolamine N-methyltransferase
MQQTDDFADSRRVRPARALAEAGRPLTVRAGPTELVSTETPPAIVREHLAFLRGFLQRPGQVGSVVPSSSLLKSQLVRTARLSGADCVVELGPGTGGTTRALLRAMPSSARLLAIELSPSFHSLVRNQIKDPRLIAQLGSAEHVREHLTAWRLPSPDAIVSGIPFSTMTPDMADRIAAAVTAVLAPGGRFVAYQFRSHVARYLSRHLGEPERQWQLLNVPPVRVFAWTKSVR